MHRYLMHLLLPTWIDTLYNEIVVVLPLDAMLARYMLWPSSVRRSACPSVTSRSSVKTAKRIIARTTPHDSLGI